MPRTDDVLRVEKALETVQAVAEDAGEDTLARVLGDVEVVWSAGSVVLLESKVQPLAEVIRQALQGERGRRTVRARLTGSVHAMARLGAALHELGQAPARETVTEDELRWCREAESLSATLLVLARDSYRVLGIRWTEPAL